jgi:hypothetical protein
VLSSSIAATPVIGEPGIVRVVTDRRINHFVPVGQFHGPAAVVKIGGGVDDVPHARIRRTFQNFFPVRIELLGCQMGVGINERHAPPCYFTLLPLSMAAAG